MPARRKPSTHCAPRRRTTRGDRYSTWARQGRWATRSPAMVRSAHLFGPRNLRGRSHVSALTLRRRRNHMGISVSLLLIAAGLILLVATTLNAIGWILLIVGAIGIVLSLIFW